MSTEAAPMVRLNFALAIWIVLLSMGSSAAYFNLESRIASHTFAAGEASYSETLWRTNFKLPRLLATIRQVRQRNADGDAAEAGDTPAGDLGYIYYTHHDFSERSVYELFLAFDTSCCAMKKEVLILQLTHYRGSAIAT